VHDVVDQLPKMLLLLMVVIIPQQLVKATGSPPPCPSKHGLKHGTGETGPGFPGFLNRSVYIKKLENFVTKICEATRFTKKNCGEKIS
jgi:hypothetical protein